MQNQHQAAADELLDLLNDHRGPLTGSGTASYGAGPSDASAGTHYGGALGSAYGAPNLSAYGAPMHHYGATAGLVRPLSRGGDQGSSSTSIAPPGPSSGAPAEAAPFGAPGDSRGARKRREDPAGAPPPSAALPPGPEEDWTSQGAAGSAPRPVASASTDAFSSSEFYVAPIPTFAQLKNRKKQREAGK